MLKITKQSITLTKGDDASIQLIPRYKDKTAYVFLEGDRGVFRLKTGNTLIEKECDIYQDPNKMVVSFQPADTINLKPGIYRYEVELKTIYGFHYTFIADQTFIIGNEYEQRLQASGSNGSGNAGSNLPEIDGELTEDPVVSGEIQPTNPSVDYNNLTNKPKLNGVQIAGNHDNAYYGIPTELADLTADADHRTVSDTEKETWNAKSDFSGSYNDLTDVPEDLVEDAEYVHTDNNYTGAEKTKLGDIESGAEVNVQADWNETDTSSDAYIQNKPTIPAAQVNSDWNASSGVAEILHKPTLGTAAAKDYTGSVLENSTDLVESGAVKTAIDNAISSVYKPAGNKACAELVSALLIAANLGNVYNMTDDGVTTADFVEGAGKAIEAGDNVVIVDIGSSVYKFDLLSGMVDLSNYVQKSSTAGLIKNDGTIDQTAYAKQNEMSVSTNGDQTTIQLKNGTTATVINAHQDISGKANKSEMTVTPGTGSDADKTTIQLKSGTDATVLTQHQDISGKVDKEQGKGLSTNDYTTAEKEKLAAISTEANKVTASETNGNIQIDGTETTVYDDTELQGAVSDLEDDVEEIQGEITTETATIEGNPLNFSTKSAQNAKSTILSLEPIQDLHGYDKPWTGGAGKNLIGLNHSPNKAQVLNAVTIITQTDGSVELSTTSGNYPYLALYYRLKAGTYTVSIKATCSDSYTPILVIFKDGTSTALANNVTQGNNKTFTISEDTDVDVRFFTGGSAAPSTTRTITYYDVQLEENSTATSYEPYSNICPITGRTEIGILGCGKNLIDLTKYANGLVSLTVGDSIDNITTSSRYAYSPIYKLTDGIVTMKTLDISKVNWGCVVYGKNGKVVKNVNSDLTTSMNTFYQNTDEYDCIRVQFGAPSGVIADVNYVQIQLELGSQATSYKPYTKSTDLTISLGQTVYGGTLDVENGVLVVEKGIIDLGDYNYNWQTDNNRFVSTTQISNMKLPIDAYTPFNGVCSAFLVSNTDNVTGSYKGENIAIGVSDTLLRIQTKTTSDTTEFKTLVTGQKLVYELTTPTVINLEPHIIKLLKGVNNISVDDAGATITLTYRDGSVATLGDLTSAVDNLDSKIDESKILTDTATGDKYILVVTNGVLSVEQISN